MKRLLCLCLTLALALSMGVLFCANAAEDNMFKNGDFEKKLNGWNAWSNDPSNCTVEYAKGKGVDGSYALLMENKTPMANSAFQYADMKYGKTYIMQADVMYEDISPDGAGVVLGMTMYDAAANNIGEMVSGSHYGTSDGWVKINFIFTITNENAVSVNAGPRIWFSTGKVYVDNVTVTEMTNFGAEAESSTFDLTVSEVPNRFPTVGLGAEWDPKLLLPVNKERGVTDQDLELIKQRMDEMGLQSVRMMIMPEWFEPQNDNDDPKSADFADFRWDSEEGKCTLAYLKVCQELGVDVTLTWWGAAAGDWLSYPDCGDWLSAPNDLDEMAENVVTVLRYVKEQMGYDCVKGIILQNEPSYSFKVSGGVVDFDRYVQYYKTVDAYLKDAGLRESVRLIGADDAQSLGWYCRAYDELGDVCDMFDSHTYSWSYDMPYLDDLIDEFVSGRTNYSTEKPYVFGEFGDGSAQGAYAAASTETYGRGLFIASMAVNSLAAGASGLSYWPLHDVYYYYNETGGDNYGLMSMGLIGYKTDGEWSYRPTYYAWGLLCNSIPKGSEVYPVTGKDGNLIDAVAVKSPEGEWSLIAVNRSAAEQVVNIHTSLTCEMDSYLFAEGALPTDGSQIAADGKVSPTEGVYSVTLPAYSFKVLRGTPDVQEGTDSSAEVPTEQESLPEDNGGCKSLAAPVAALAVAAAAAVACKKKKD